MRKRSPRSGLACAARAPGVSIGAATWPVSRCFALPGCSSCLAWLPAGWAQFAAPKVARIDIKHIGPPAASDELIRSNIRVKAGDPYLPRGGG